MPIPRLEASQVNLGSGSGVLDLEGRGEIDLDRAEGLDSGDSRFQSLALS